MIFLVMLRLTGRDQHDKVIGSRISMFLCMIDLTLFCCLLCKVLCSLQQKGRRGHQLFLSLDMCSWFCFQNLREVITGYRLRTLAWSGAHNPGFRFVISGKIDVQGCGAVETGQDDFGLPRRIYEK